MSLAEIRRLDAGRWFGARFAGIRVPTLEEVLELSGGRCALNVELKGAGVEGEVCRLLRAHRALPSAMVSSFDWSALAQARS
jgi:glycerophosphoryl diester phosphodiesterase